jgi:hypothetical protein
MKKGLFIIIGLFIISQTFGQENDSQKQNVLILNMINPGIEYEYSISDKSKIALNIGIGVSMSYPELTKIQPDHAFFISSFLDLHYKNIYNYEKRKSNNRNVEYNAGNFIGIKLIGRGKSFNSTITRTDNVDFTFGPTWGMRRNFNKINMLFDLGPVYYFDTRGNSGFYPIMFEINIGYNILKKK